MEAHAKYEQADDPEVDVKSEERCCAGWVIATRNFERKARDECGWICARGWPVAGDGAGPPAAGRRRITSNLLALLWLQII